MINLGLILGASQGLAGHFSSSTEYVDKKASGEFYKGMTKDLVRRLALVDGKINTKQLEAISDTANRLARKYEGLKEDAIDLIEAKSEAVILSRYLGQLETSNQDTVLKCHDDSAWDVLEYLFRGKDKSFRGRMLTLQNTIEYFMIHFLGLGPGTFDFNMEQAQEAFAKFMDTSVRNHGSHGHHVVPDNTLVDLIDNSAGIRYKNNALRFLISAAKNLAHLTRSPAEIRADEANEKQKELRQKAFERDLETRILNALQSKTSIIELDDWREVTNSLQMRLKVQETGDKHARFYLIVDLDDDSRITDFTINFSNSSIANLDECLQNRMNIDFDITWQAEYQSAMAKLRKRFFS